MSESERSALGRVRTRYWARFIITAFALVALIGVGAWINSTLITVVAILLYGSYVLWHIIQQDPSTTDANRKEADSDV